MVLEETYLKGCYILTPNVYKDNRGTFLESFNQIAFETAMGIKTNFVQDNQSISSKGVLRGLHFQRGDFAQAKLVRVVKGSVLDVCVDIREGSSTFGNHFSVILDDISNKQLFIPRGFAHGFLVLENETVFNYKCDNYYNKGYESGIIYNDKDININWSTPNNELIISDKDLLLPSFESLFK